MTQMSLMPYFTQQFFDSNGDPLSGGKLYFYEPGTTTDKNVYSDSGGLTTLTNPVILDSSGRTSIWLNGYYKVVMHDLDDVEVDSLDNVSGQYYQVTSNIQWTLQNDALTYIGATQFSVLTDKTATYEIGRRLKTVVTAGTIYGTVTASTSAGSPVTTTVTVLWDSGSLDSGLSAVSTGILTVANPSVPVLPVQGKSANYSLALTDNNKMIPLSANASALTLLAANAVTDGFNFSFINTGANQATLTGTVNGFANVTFLQYEGAALFSDGTNWYSHNMHNQDAVGTVKAWHKSLTGVPSILPWGWVECIGQTLSDSESPMNGETLPDLNNNGRFIRGSNTSGDTQANQNLEHLHNNTLSASGTDAGVIVPAYQDANSNYWTQNLVGTTASSDYTRFAPGNESPGLKILSSSPSFSTTPYITSNNIASALNYTNANEGASEARPDNISMVYIMKIK